MRSTGRWRKTSIRLKVKELIEWMRCHVHRGLHPCYRDRRRYEEAAFELKKGLCINSSDLSARINLGVLYGDQERWKEARREYRKILQITPEDEHIRKLLESIS